MDAGKKKRKGVAGNAKAMPPCQSMSGLPIRTGSAVSPLSLTRVWSQAKTLRYRLLSAFCGSLDIFGSVLVRPCRRTSNCEERAAKTNQAWTARTHRAAVKVSS